MTAEFSLAVHALTYLCVHDRSVTSEELSENICTNPARVRKVMRFMKAAGFVETKEGITGGYIMRVQGEEISLKSIADALNMPYISVSWKSGDVDMDCMVASGMADVMNEIYGKLNDICAQRLETVTIEDIRKKLSARWQAEKAVKKDENVHTEN